MENINKTAILQFIERYKRALQSKSKEMRLTIEEAGLLTASLAAILVEKEEQKPEIVITQPSEEAIEIEFDAGGFK